MTAPSADQLYDLIEAVRKEGAETAQKLGVTRCSRGCRQRGEYLFRGQRVTIAGPIRLHGLRVPGRAWVGDAPAGEPFGCAHELLTEGKKKR
jgi:hypothetical protein